MFKNTNLLIACFILFFLSINVFNCNSLIASQNDEITPVVAQRAIQQNISRNIITSADILPSLTALLHPESIGRIEKVFVEEGSIVNKDQILAKVDQRTQSAQVQQAQAAVKVAKAAIEMQKVMIQSASSGLVAAKAGVKSINARLNNTTVRKNRIKELYLEGAVSRQQLDDLSAEYDSLKANLVSAQSEVKRAHDAVKSSEMTLNMRRAELVQAEANLEAARVQLDKTYIKAPFEGVIVKRMSDPGAMANPSVPVFRLDRVDPVKIEVSVIERDLHQIVAGKTAAMIETLAATEPVRTVISKKHPVINPANRTGKLEIILENPQMKLLSGMFANVSLILESFEDTVVVDREALMRHNLIYYAYIVENERAVRRQVTVGIIDNNRVQILNGINPGDIYISRGTEFIREGQRVRPRIGVSN